MTTTTTTTTKTTTFLGCDLIELNLVLWNFWNTISKCTCIKKVLPYISGMKVVMGPCIHLKLYISSRRTPCIKEQTEPKILAELRLKAEIRLRLGRNRTPIYKFQFRLGRNRNLITNFGLNQIFRPKLWKARHRIQTWKKVLTRGHYTCTFLRIVEISGWWKIIFSYFGIKPYKL